MKVTFHRLREVLNYDPDTGIFRWLICAGSSSAGRVAGGRTLDGYNQIRIDGVMHRSNLLAWMYMTGEWPSEFVDHENRIKHDDRWKNLRLATRSQNAMNRESQSNNTSGAKGVNVVNKKSKPFRCRIKADGKHIHLGYFATLEEAEKVYIEASKRYFGKFSCASL
jgi:hypothetical protein